MQKIEEKAFEIYNENMIYFKMKHPKLFQQLTSFITEIEQGNYKEKYALEYLDNYFDIQELSSERYLYAKSSSEFSQALTANVNFKKNSMLFDGFPLYYQYEKHLDNLDDKGRGLDEVYPIMTYYLDNIKTSDEMRTIEKFIFIGVGLGEHLIKIDEKIAAEEYLVIEDDLELFRLSLFVTPYYMFENRIVDFCVAQSDGDFTNTMNDFLNRSVFQNKFLKYSFFPAHSEYKIKLIQNSIASQAFISFPYKIYLNKCLRILDSIDSGYNILNISQRVEKSYLSKKPAIVVGAGPSLGKNIEWLRQNQHKFTIIAVTSALKYLSQYKIKPDIAVHLDGFNLSLSLFEGFDAKNFLKDVTVILGSFTPCGISQYFSKENIFFTEEETCYNEDFYTNTGPCVGSTSIMHALMLNIEEIYLLGIDLAIDTETGKSHIDAHIATKKVETKNITKLKDSMSFRDNFFSIAGNLQETVYTNTLFQVSIQTLFNRLPQLQARDQKIYNLSDGAYFKNTIPTKIEDVNTSAFSLVDKQNLHNKLQELLVSHSRNILTPKDKNSLHKREQFAKEIKAILDKYNDTCRFENSMQYVADLLGLTLDILQVPRRETLNLITAYDLYLSYVLPLVVDFFNTKDLKNQKKHMKVLHEFIMKGMYEIATIYEEKIEKFLVETHTES